MKATLNDANSALATLTGAGHTAYLAGGCVRDMLIGLQPNDYDVATSATPQEVQACFPHTIPVGISFGVVKVIFGEDRELDVATFRTDGAYTDNRRPDDVKYSVNAVEDVQRRDFTINAILMDESGQVLDYVGGQEDLKNRVLRTVGDPNQRFAEDSLRMVRAIRFASRFNMDIDPATWTAIRERTTSIQNVSKERMTEELTKIFLGPRPEQAFLLLLRSRLWRSWFQDANINSADALRALYALPRLVPGDSFVLVLAILTSGMYTSTKQGFFDSLCLTTHQKRDYNSLLKHAEALRNFINEPLAEQRKMMNWEDLDLVYRLFDVAQDFDMYAYKRPSDTSIADIHEQMAAVRSQPWPTPLLKGDDLIAMGFTTGPIYTSMLSEAWDAQLEGRLNTHTNLKEFIINLFPCAERKLDDGTLLNGMTPQRMVAQCTKCRVTMSFMIGKNERGDKLWGTITDPKNVHTYSCGIYFMCMNCNTKRAKTGFVRMNF